MWTFDDILVFVIIHSICHARTFKPKPNCLGINMLQTSIDPNNKLGIKDSHLDMPIKYQCLIDITIWCPWVGPLVPLLIIDAMHYWFTLGSELQNWATLLVTLLVERKTLDPRSLYSWPFYTHVAKDCDMKRFKNSVVMVKGRKPWPRGIQIYFWSPGYGI